jgi:hypothetical protein
MKKKEWWRSIFLILGLLAAAILVAQSRQLRDPGVFLRPMYLGKAAQESRVAINPKDNCKGGSLQDEANGVTNRDSLYQLMAVLLRRSDKGAIFARRDAIALSKRPAKMRHIGEAPRKCYLA